MGLGPRRYTPYNATVQAPLPRLVRKTRPWTATSDEKQGVLLVESCRHCWGLHPCGLSLTHGRRSRRAFPSGEGPRIGSGDNGTGHTLSRSLLTGQLHPKRELKQSLVVGLTKDVGKDDQETTTLVIDTAYPLSMEEVGAEACGLAYTSCTAS